ncbi:MAG: prepilin peptidase, partial [Firmicutes bacterium]|nr:prepilin peptidase [Bacillota bacterium]
VISHIAGMLIISVPLLILFMLSGGRAIGGGDVKLFFAAGLALGASSTVVAFFISFLLAAVIHIARMKLAGAESRLAMGPYIAAGVCISIWFGPQIVSSYMALML